jgi:hypothetical protein
MIKLKLKKEKEKEKNPMDIQNKKVFPVTAIIATKIYTMFENITVLVKIYLSVIKKRISQRKPY